MTNRPTTENLLHGIREALAELRERGQRPATLRRRLRTLAQLADCKATAKFRAWLARAAAAEGIYCSPPPIADGLGLDDWLLFSDAPIPDEATLFPRERDLERFVEACLGFGHFSQLALWRHGKLNGRQFVLPSGRRVDLLCERRVPKRRGDLVAMELKREYDRGVVLQVIQYIDELRSVFAGRQVGGIIITASADPTDVALIRSVEGYDITWLCYDVTFRKSGTSAGAK